MSVPGTFRTWRDVRFESGMRTKADVRRPSCAQPDTPSSRYHLIRQQRPSDQFLNFRTFRLPTDPNQFTDSHRLVPIEGRLAIVTNAGRDAVDAVSALDERTAAYGQVVSFWRPNAGVKSAIRTAATVSNKPGHRGEHEASRKTIARGMPGRTGVTVVTTLVCFFISHARLRVHRAPGIPCAL